MGLHMAQVEKVIDLLVYMLRTCDPDGIDLYLTSRRVKQRL